MHTREIKIKHIVTIEMYLHNAHLPTKLVRLVKKLLILIWTFLPRIRIRPITHDVNDKKEFSTCPTKTNLNPQILFTQLFLLFQRTENTEGSGHERSFDLQHCKNTAHFFPHS